MLWAGVVPPAPALQLTKRWTRTSSTSERKVSSGTGPAMTLVVAEAGHGG